jgi:hypothetical protein
MPWAATNEGSRTVTSGALSLLRARAALRSIIKPTVMTASVCCCNLGCGAETPGLAVVLSSPEGGRGLTRYSSGITGRFGETSLSSPEGGGGLTRYSSGITGRFGETSLASARLAYYETLKMEAM